VYNMGIMPELPEVETVRRGLKPFILNKKIIQVIPEPGKGFYGSVIEVDGATVVDIRRKGKALLVDLDNGNTLMIHLRMTGQLIWRGKNAKVGQVDDAEQFAAGHPSKNFTSELPNKQTRVTFVFAEGKLFFNDQRKFGFVKVLPTAEVESDKFIAELGKEPWDMSSDELYAKCQRHGRSPIKAVLLNQKLIAGLGNIYADESLFYASVHPAILAGILTESQVAKILEGACKTMNAAIDSGGSTMATYVRPDGTTGDYLEKFAQVFRREGQKCNRCGAVIEKTRCAGRGTHFCPKCQGKGSLS
jgi:formamidopyrimidine-DNA glycosylase